MRKTDKNDVTIKLLPLSQEDLDILIYTTSDIWITPELRRFKNGILDGLEKKEAL